MAENENKSVTERGPIKSLLYSLLSSSEKTGGTPLPEKAPESTAPASPGEGEEPLSSASAPSSEADSGTGGEPQRDPNLLPAAGNPLYELYLRRMGLPPLGDDPAATFPLSLFMEDGRNPDEEENGMLRRLEGVAQQLLRQTARTPGGDDDLQKEEPLDAKISVFISRDKMRAFVFSFPPAFSGREADEDMLRTHLEIGGVAFGVDEEKLKRIGESPSYFKLTQIAEGQPPIHGENGQVVDHYKRELEIRLTVREDNTIDYKDLGWLQTINTEETICLLVPPTPAVPGHNVTGAEVRGKDGQKAMAPMGQNTRVNDDGSALIATIDGVVTFANGRFRVDPILIIKGNISTETGNLDTIGDILIHGDIQEGFTVQATGNITVQGMIEGATVMAGGDIQVGRGMNGNSHGVLEAKGEVRCKFLENATVTAGGKIICDTIINSTVSSDIAVMVTTGRGAIIGGQITALERIEAKSIGNQSNRSIVITMGNTANLLRDKHEAEQKKRALELEVEETFKNISFLSAGANPSADLDQMADDLKLKLSVLKMQLANTSRQLEALNKKQVSNADCRLRAEVLYPPAQITIGNATKILRQMSFNPTIYYNKGEISIANI